MTTMMTMMMSSSDTGSCLGVSSDSSCCTSSSPCSYGKVIFLSFHILILMKLHLYFSVVFQWKTRFYVPHHLRIYWMLGQLAYQEVLQGDCDGDNDCIGNLVCGTDNCAQVLLIFRLEKLIDNCAQFYHLAEPSYDCCTGDGGFFTCFVFDQIKSAALPIL